MSMEHHLGIVTAGSLNKGIEVKLDGAASIEDMAVGRYVTIEGNKRRFFGMITDVSLGVTDPALTVSPPSDDGFLSEILTGTSAYGSLHVAPYLTIGGTETAIDGPQPVKTIPGHFSPVKEASAADIELVFGKEDAKKFWIGNPLDMEVKLCLDLQNLAKRSNGIFGKSGTGKTFLTRMLLIGLLQKSAAVNLVFDMHSEYGWAGTFEGKGRKVKALKQLFPSKVAVFTLDEENSRQRGVSTDFVVRIGLEEIEPEDISLLRQTLNLTDAAVEAVYQLRRHYGKGWFTAAEDIEDSATLDELKIHESTFQNLRRGLNTIRRLPFIAPNAPGDVVDTMLKYLESGKHVVLEFGRYTDITAYMLVANLLTRRIYASYRDRTEKAVAADSGYPTPLVITIEEAHKFLNSGVASQTIFGTIAREMRKYSVTLLIIDQRPSGIDDEIMSQLGTKITCLLDSEKDIDAVLSGVSGKNELKNVLAKLSSRQQALIFGHAVPMPVAFTPREYGSDYGDWGDTAAQVTDKEIEELWE
ncbi:MAG: ATP-binding protein [Dehalogenimonas sp.]|uniref:ATP-binding protein n=1 Tax=Candidatus Dehalogenimonas loeffleri TaxID=3127115 RepID=A0ABZ2J4X8_9CHLR|nr:ATP-binding protein [Dehalogenimonas sp.]